MLKLKYNGLSATSFSHYPVFIQGQWYFYHIHTIIITCCCLNKHYNYRTLSDLLFLQPKPHFRLRMKVTCGKMREKQASISGKYFISHLFVCLWASNFSKGSVRTDFDNMGLTGSGFSERLPETGPLACYNG